MSTETTMDLSTLQAKIRQMSASDSPSLLAILEVCSGDGMGPATNVGEWITCLSNIYQTLLPTPPTVTEYANALYSVWGNPASYPDWQTRVTCSEILNALVGIQAAAGTPAYTASESATAANINFLDISVSIDTARLVANYNNQPGNHNASEYVSMTDNHPSEDQGEGSNELRSDCVIPDMTICWTAQSGSTPAPAITLTQFETCELQVFERFAPPPVAISGTINQFATRSNATIPVGNAQYSFEFQVAGCAATFRFDPFLGNNT